MIKVRQAAGSKILYEYLREKSESGFQTLQHYNKKAPKHS